jgi:UDP-N-acetylglucosamine acyltransferase
MIHPTAIVEDGAKLGNNVKIGPFCHVGPHVVLDKDVELISHAIVTGHTHIGEGTKVYPFAAIGFPPQSTVFSGESSRISIGKNNLIREHVTIHPGTQGGGMVTSIGDDCMIMINAHIGHDCQIGNKVIMANNTTLGGHVIVEDFVFLGGLTGVHQKVRLGMGCIIGGLSGVENDVIPFGSVMGNRARLAGLNLVGLKRRGVPRESIHKLRTAYRLLFADEGTLDERIEDVKGMFPKEDIINQVIEFMQSPRHRPLCLPGHWPTDV